MEVEKHCHEYLTDSEQNYLIGLYKDVAHEYDLILDTCVHIRDLALTSDDTNAKMTAQAYNWSIPMIEKTRDEIYEILEKLED